MIYFVICPSNRNFKQNLSNSGVVSFGAMTQFCVEQRPRRPNVVLAALRCFLVDASKRFITSAVELLNGRDRTADVPGRNSGAKFSLSLANTWQLRLVP